MSNASARRSFHGPFLPTKSPARSRVPAAQLALLLGTPSVDALGQQLLRAARDEEPNSSARERILQSVLAALKCLTGTRA